MNKVTLLGRLTKEPELRYTNNNTTVCNFSIAVNRRFVKQGEEKQADFFNCVAWSKNAEFVSKYFAKGQQVLVVGRLETRTWEDEKGKHYATDIVVEENYFADGKKDSAGQQGNTSSFSTEVDENLPF